MKISLSENIDYFEEVEGNAKRGHVVLPLQGKFEGENKESCHCVAVTS